MDDLNSILESILFVASAPVSVTKLIKLLKVDRETLTAVLENIREKYAVVDSGLTILSSGDDWQMVARAENNQWTEKFIKAEASGELTRPQLETLTVISYCGPITKPELEQIRGVNCSLILRNLLVRGLIKENVSGAELLPAYEVSLDYLRFLGINNVRELPEYEKLREHEHLARAKAGEDI